MPTRGYTDVSRESGDRCRVLPVPIIGEVMFKSLSLAQERLMILSLLAYRLSSSSSGRGSLLDLIQVTSFYTSALILAVCLMIPTFKAKILKGTKLSK